jgi:hypothetical protein
MGHPCPLAIVAATHPTWPSPPQVSPLDLPLAVVAAKHTQHILLVAVEKNLSTSVLAISHPIQVDAINVHVLHQLPIILAFSTFMNLLH